MSQTQKTQTSNVYNPQSMSSYHDLIQQGGGILQQNINNPQGNPFFSGMQQRGNTAIGRQTGSLTGQQGQNSAALGTNLMNPSAYNASQTTANQRFGTAAAGQMAQSLNMGALQARQNSILSAMNFRPLQTGGTQTQTQSGLGTWLPQVASFGMGAALAPFTGGTSMLNTTGKGSGPLPFTSQGMSNMQNSGVFGLPSYWNN
jgi:hypothetical protein